MAKTKKQLKDEFIKNFTYYETLEDTYFMSAIHYEKIWSWILENWSKK